jgi:hypothetical protein
MPTSRPIWLTIIVPAYNCARELRACLTALIAAAPTEEIVVVDDASIDSTGEVAAAMGARVLRLAKNSGPAAARNHGAGQARGAVLLFVDADVVVARDVISRIRQAFDGEPQLAAVFGSYDASPAAPGLVSRYRNLLHHFVHQQGDPEAATFWAGLGAVRRAVFVEVGGFDAQRFPRPSIEDIELGYRLRRAGHRIRLDRHLLGTHLKAWTLWSMIRTDVTARALPWARLILESGTAPAALNLRGGQWLSALLVAVAGLAAVLTPVLAELRGLALACLLAVLVLNRRFYALLADRGGLPLALTAVPLHLLYFLYSGTSFLYVCVEWSARHVLAVFRRLTGAIRAW